VVRGWWLVPRREGKKADPLLQGRNVHPPRSGSQLLKSCVGSGAVAGVEEVFLNAESTENTERGRGQQELGEAGGLGGANMRHGSTRMDYCQGTVLWFDHSNVRRGSGMDGRGWREFCSLVRRIRKWVVGSE
jgi:hypothetical protein